VSALHVCCYSGGHSSAIVAIEVARRFGPENTVLVNHDIHFAVEDHDIKRFKIEVADYIGVPITFANYKNQPAVLVDQFDVCVKAQAFKVGDGSELCTSRLKTEPFRDWLSDNMPPGSGIIYYGFDPGETKRIQRRTGIMGALGYRTDYPAALWVDRTIRSTEEVGIARPQTYGVFKHGNCVGCLKAGWQHWYIVYCTRQDIWLKAKWAEEEIGYAIHHDESGPVFLEDMEDRFAKMQAAGVPATENVPHQTWWAQARKIVKIHEAANPTMPCDCATLGGGHG
jgi:hypothetical protein